MTTGVRYLRGEHPESFHRVHAAVVDADGRAVARVGDPERWTFFRSAAKPLQALPLVVDGAADRLGIPPDELAICCASHGGTAEHRERVRSLLDRAGLGVEDLECGARRPLGREAREELRREGTAPTPLHDNCSGKHAGMLALAVDAGWPTDGYPDEAHPVQRRMMEEVGRWTGCDDEALRTAVDGCGVVCFAVPLRRMAFSYARLARAAREAKEEAPARLVAAMTDHPFLVAGTDRLDTVLMEAAGGSLFAKSGSEGVRCVGVPDEGLGIALKVEDGAERAADPALVRVLDALGLPRGDGEEALERFRSPKLRNARGRVVGRIEATFEVSGA